MSMNVFFTYVFRGSRIVFGVFMFLLFLSFIFVIVMHIGGKTIFEVEARTELISGKIARSTAFELANATICIETPSDRKRSRNFEQTGESACGYGYMHLERFDGLIGLEANATFTIERLYRGPLKMKFWSDEDVLSLIPTMGPAITVSGRKVIIQVDAPAKILIEPLVIVSFFANDFQLGGEVALRTSVGNKSNLLSGNVTMLSEAVIDDGHLFKAGEIDLSYGDFLHIGDKVGDHNPVTLGILRVTEEPGFFTVFRFEAEQAFISRFSSKGFSVSVTLWDRMTRDPFSTILWSIFSFVVGSGVFSIVFRGSQSARNE